MSSLMFYTLPPVLFGW